MKKYTKLLLIFICTFLVIAIEQVDASIDKTTIDLECIYASGVSISRNYVDGATSISINDYPVYKSVQIDDDSISSYHMFDANGQDSKYNLQYMENNTCPSEVDFWKLSLKTKDEDTGDWKTTITGLYSFSRFYNGTTIYDYYGGDEGLDNSTGWWIFGKSATIKQRILPIQGGTLAGQGIIIPLVAERLYVVGDLATSDYSLAYKSSGGEVISKNDYVQFLKYGNVYYAKKGKTMTSLSSGAENIIGADSLCFKLSNVKNDSSRTEMTYKYDGIRNEIKKINANGTCDAGYIKYDVNDTQCEIEKSSKTSKSFCDVYGNTAAVLIRIIDIMQYVVPALVIVLTAVDITRMVIAGNIEEELPKRKKLMIIRGIFMLVFFFLPVIMNIIINLLSGITTYDVSCLYNNGVSVHDDDINCVEK